MLVIAIFHTRDLDLHALGIAAAVYMASLASALAGLAWLYMTGSRRPPPAARVG